MFGFGGWGLDQNIIIDNGSNFAYIQDQDTFYGQQEIIIDRGNGVTVIEQNAGWYGGGMGMGMMGGCMGYGCMGACCRNREIVVVEPIRQVRYEQPQVYHQQVQQVYQQRPQAYQQAPHVYQQAQQQQQQQQQQQVFQDIPLGQPIPQQPPSQEIVLYNNTMLQLSYQQWQPKVFDISRLKFGAFNMNYISKIKCRMNYQPYSDRLNNGEIILKVVEGDQDRYFAARAHIIREYYCAFLHVKTRHHYEPGFEFEGVEGAILKKSGLMGAWETRFVKIDPVQGMKVYKNPSHNHTAHVKSTRELWTWFEIVQGNFVVIKIKHNGSKMEFGLPLANVTLWVNGFFSLLEKYQ